jgi:hypothetical protein
MANLAATWQQQSRSDEAEELELQVLELRKDVLGEKHPDTITAMANLAATWRQQGQSDEVEQLQAQVVELWKSVLGNKHPHTVAAMKDFHIHQISLSNDRAQKGTERVPSLETALSSSIQHSSSSTLPTRSSWSL